MNYEERVAAQIEQYAESIDMHALPKIFHVWSTNYIAPQLEAVFGTRSIDEIYALTYIESGADPAAGGRILSIGSGSGEVEIRVAKILLERGVQNFKLVCAELSPILLERLRSQVAAEGLVDYFEAIEQDLNSINIPGRFDMIMANHALHHIVELEALFQYSHERLNDRGIFVTCDMIGRNGHMRWPEAAAFVKAIWPTLKPQQRYHVLLQKLHETFTDHDCSKVGFEGVRAEDILDLVLKKFQPYKFVGAGGIIDMFVDRGYGHGFDVNDEQDVALIRLIADINEMLLDANVIKPVWTMASFTKDIREEKFFRDRRALNALRVMSPSWMRFYS